MDMEDEIVKSYKSEENDIVDLKDVSNFLVTNVKQNEVYSENNVPVKTQNSIEKLDIKSESDNLNIKTEQTSDDEIDKQIGRPTMFEELYIKKEEIDIKHEFVSVESSFPESNPDIEFEECSGSAKDESNDILLEKRTTSTCGNSTASNAVTAVKARCKSCKKMIKGASNSTPSEHLLVKDSQTCTCGENPLKKFKCKECSYETDHRSNINKHRLRHKDRTEVKMHKCTQCEYETKYESNLTSHLIKHQDPSEVQMYHCEFCTYQSKLKSSLKSHLLSHKDPSEVEMYSCEICKYSTKYKHHLNGHMLSHKHFMEVETFKCHICEFSTKHKRALINHLLIHKSPSEVKMFKCERCIFSTKHRRSLKRHLLSYKH